MRVHVVFFVGISPHVAYIYTFIQSVITFIISKNDVLGGQLEHFRWILIFKFLCTMVEIVYTTFILQSVITLYNIEKS